MDWHLLIAEDDEFVQQLLALCLRNEGYKVSLAATGAHMLTVLDTDSVDLIVLDLGLPDEDGLTLVRQIRTRSKVPIVVLTVRQGRESRIGALELGADDYVTKPCDPEELLLRVRNLLTRSGTSSRAAKPKNAEGVLRFNGWTLNLAAHTLTAPEDRAIPITSSEFNLLTALARAPNRVLSRARLLDAVSRNENSATERTIDVLVSRLRKKMEADSKNPLMIVTVVGSGYRFSAKVL